MFHFFRSRHACPLHGKWGRAHNESSLLAKPHKSTPADFYRPITHQVIAKWAGWLSCRQCHWAGSAVVCAWDWMGMSKRGRVEEPFPLCQTDRPLDSSVAGQWISQLRPVFHRSDGSLPGPWENKGVRLHLFSVSVPQGIKGEDISNRPAWLGPTHLRGPFSPRSLQALFTHPADMACGTVVA